MGGLIQTKGTQRLQKLFNNRFSPLSTARTWTNNIGGVQTTLPAAFRNPGVNLLTLSDNFIAQYASAAAWPNNGNDLLYPSATMTVEVLPGSSSLSLNTIGFRLPPGRAAIPGHITANASFRNLDNRKTFPPTTTIAPGGVSGVAGGAGGTFTVTFTQNPILANLAVSDRISFAPGGHPQLVRRWRWYLAHDLLPENHAAIRSAISAALDDNDFTQATFQTIEDTQRVFANAQRQTDANDEFDGTFILNIILMTQQTTAPDPLDPQ
jgi:hypothetical protein